MNHPKPHPSDPASWKSAVIDLFGGGWTFARTGPRQHDDWRADARAVMTLKVTDPRGWHSVNHAPEVNENRSGTNAPFMSWSDEQLGASLHEIGPVSAGQLLVALQGEFFQAARIPGFRERREGLFRSSAEITARFGRDARFFTNAADAKGNPDADLLNPDQQWECLSVHTTDCGLVAVSDAEVGVFWSFWED
ncbi:hypothetical protein ABZX40_15535 [Streptomyces sp. NPDC004610]|uniref:hypothetical protein n=1 Tax=unclassified Streptomyces TaxID=2593676 RepID=UPI0033AACA94